MEKQNGFLACSCSHQQPSEHRSLDYSVEKRAKHFECIVNTSNVFTKYTTAARAFSQVPHDICRVGFKLPANALCSQQASFVLFTKFIFTRQGHILLICKGVALIGATVYLKQQRKSSSFIRSSGSQKQPLLGDYKHWTWDPRTGEKRTQGPRVLRAVLHCSS